MLFSAFALIVRAGFGLDGAGSVFISVPTGETPGWKSFEVLTGGDYLGALAVEGFVWDGSKTTNWDGLGAYRYDAATLRVFINNEVTGDSTINRVDLNVANLKAWILSGIANNGNDNQVAAADPVVEAVSLGWLTIDSGVELLSRLCTGNVWGADTFGNGIGFEDTLYLTCEENAGVGNFWVMDVATRTLYKAVDLGEGTWENATPLDTGRTDTIALILSEDGGASTAGTAPLRLYVGLKNPAGNFLERNGLSGGTVYYWDPAGAGTNGTMTGIFSAGNGAVVSGEWTLDGSGAALFSKSEDVHVNMNRDSDGYGVEVALASQEEAVFKVDLSTLDFVAGDLGVGRSCDITVLYAAGTQSGTNSFTSMDNVVWSANGLIYVNEDDGEGDIWVVDPVSLEASYAASDFTPDGSQVYDIMDADTVGETSGIIDISECLDYQPGSIFLTTGYYNGVLTKNQLVMLVSPTAATFSAAYGDWSLGYPELDSEAVRLRAADPDQDGLSNDLEFALGLSPVEADSASFLALDPSLSWMSFTPARSLNLVDYYIEYTSDLLAGFPANQSIRIRSDLIDDSGLATVALPVSDRLFVRLRVEVP